MTNVEKAERFDNIREYLREYVKREEPNPPPWLISLLRLVGIYAVSCKHGIAHFTETQHKCDGCCSRPGARPDQWPAWK